MNYRILNQDQYLENLIDESKLLLLNNDSYTNELYLLPAGAAVNANRTILEKDIKLFEDEQQVTTEEKENENTFSSEEKDSLN